MDDLDGRLLGLLRENARLPLADLARRLGVSRTTAQSRLERLERRGIVVGYTVRLAPDHQQTMIRAHIAIAVSPKAAPRVEAGLRALDPVVTLHAVSGPFDLIALAATASVQAMNALIDAIGTMPGVERTTSSIVLSTRFDR